MHISRGRGARSAIAFAVVLMLACCAAGSSAVAAAPARHSYKLVVSPQATLAGANGKVGVAITNTSSPGTSLGSARVSAPAGFKLRRVSLPRGVGGLAVIRHNRIVLRDLSVAPGSTLHLRVTVTAPLVCSPSPGHWHATVWRGQLGGGQLQLKPKKSRTAGAVSCPFSLRFTTQPTNATIGQPITGSPDNPHGSPVTVEVFNASGKLIHISALVKITLGTNPNGATLGGTTVARTVNGVVSFKNLTLNKPGGGYTLNASSAVRSGTASHGFNENQAASQNCASGQPCSTTLSTSHSSATVGVSAGATNATVTESVDFGTSQNSNPGCSFYTPPPGSVDWYGINVSATDRSKTITWTVNSANFTKFHVCFGAAYPSGFQAVNSSGNVQQAPSGTLPDGTTQNAHVGVLATCDQVNPSSNPCVAAIGPTPNGSGTIVTVQIPAGLQGDPFFGY